MSEQWKSLAPEYPAYEVSDHGRVRRAVTSKNGRWRKGRLLKPFPNTRYSAVNLMDRHGGHGLHRVAYLVANAFLGPRPTGYYLHFKDWDYHNFSPGNMEYLTKKEVHRLSSEQSRAGGLLTSDEVEYARAKRAEGSGLREIARELHVSEHLVGYACRGKTYRYHPGPITDNGSVGGAPRKITDDQVLEALDLREQGWMLQEIADVLHVTEGHVSRICAGKTRVSAWK